MHRVLVIALFVLGISAMAGSATVTYTSYLTDRNNKPRPLNGQLVYFRLYADSAATTPIWEEYHGIIAPKGLITVALGSRTPLPLHQIASVTSLWLEMQIVTDPAFPRQKIATSFFSIAANYADSARHAVIADSSKKAGLSANSAKLGGVDANKFLSWNDTGRVDIAPSNGRASVSIPQGKFEIGGYSDSYFGIKNPGGSYARLVSLDSSNQKHFAGLTVNGYVRSADGSLKQDAVEKPTWMLGLDATNDQFSVMRAPSGSTYASHLAPLLTVNKYGYVGIGLDSARAMLDVYGDIRTSGAIEAYALRLDYSYGLNAATIEVNPSYNLRFMLGSGDHHIEFHKTGMITAAGFRVDSSQITPPDYVFEEDYNLMNLEEVEKYIITNKHLPGIPSAAEMQKDGVDLLKMNMDLLKKVEELTLYVIQQQREIEELRTGKE